MKKIFVLLLLPLLSFSFIADWQPVKIGDRVTVKFPKEPKFEKISDKLKWASSFDANSICEATLTDLREYGIKGPDDIAKNFSSQEQMQGFGIGLLSKIPGGKAISQKNTLFNGHRSYEYIIEVKKDGVIDRYIYIKSLFVGTDLISFHFIQKEKERSKNNQRFFSSIKVD